MDFVAARTKMVDNQIRTTDVTGHDVLRAFLSVAREDFVPEARRPLAYIDVDIPLGNNRFLMEPSPFAKLLQLAAIGDGDVVLDVGCGTGYSSAILAQLAREVVALEEDAELARIASAQLKTLGAASCTVVEAPLTGGVPSRAPFDVIIFEGAVGRLPEIFFGQMREGGRLAVVEGSGNAAAAKLYVKEDGIVSDRFGFNCSIKSLPGFAAKREFVF